MTTVAKGPKKPSNGSNISLSTMDFLMKGHVLYHIKKDMHYQWNKNDYHTTPRPIPPEAIRSQERLALFPPSIVPLDNPSRKYSGN